MSYTLSILNIEFSCLYIASETVSMLLVQVWARLRSSLYVHDCLNGFLISIIVSYLVVEGKINHDMKAMGIFRAALKFVGMQSNKYFMFIYIYVYVEAHKLSDLVRDSNCSCSAATHPFWKHGLYFPPAGQKALSDEVCCVIFIGFFTFWYILLGMPSLIY